MTDLDVPVLRALRQKLPITDRAHRAHVALDIIGDMLGWLVGTAWVVDESAARLRPIATWRARVHKATDFESLTLSMSFVPGQGLPGRVWASGKPLWIEDVSVDSNFPRAGAARMEGLHGAVCIPLYDDATLIGVVEFFTDQFRSPVPAMIAILEVAGREIGAALGPEPETAPSVGAD